MSLETDEIDWARDASVTTRGGGGGGITGVVDSLFASSFVGSDFT